MSAVDILFWICVFILWHGTLYLVHRYTMLRKVEMAWTVGHKLGKVAGMMSPQWVDEQLRASGIKLSDLPPVE